MDLLLMHTLSTLFFSRGIVSWIICQLLYNPRLGSCKRQASPSLSTDLNWLSFSSCAQLEGAQGP